MPVRKQSTPVWERRHPWVVALITAQAVTLTVLSAAAHVNPVALLLPALTAVPAAVLGAVPDRSRSSVAGVSAATLLVQSIYAIVVFGGSSGANALLLSTLCVIALYEVGRVQAVAFAVAVAAVVSIVILDPTTIDLPTNADGHLWGVIGTGLVALSVGSAALVALWREHARVRHVADQQRRATEGFLEVVGSLMLVLDRNGIVRVANRLACLTLDREEDEIVGREWFELALPPEYRDEARRLYALSYDAWRDTGQVSYEPIDYENEIEARDGSRRQITWWATMVTNRVGEPVGMVCSGTDVTEGRAARAALERSGLELDALRRLAQKVASLDDSRQAVVDAALDLTGASAAVIFEPDRTQSTLGVTTSTRADLVGHSVEVGREASVVASAFLSGQPHFVADAEGAPGVNQRLVEACSAASLLHQPVMGGHGVVGVLSVTWQDRVPSLHERKAELVGLIAHEAAIALRRRESLVQLERAALVDPLTGVANRRAFDAELPIALRRAAEGAYPLGLVVLDLNEFKAVNDRYGHEAGDELLIQAASSWAGVLRAGDLLARLGGDEFAVLLPSCEQDEMEHIIQRLKRATPHQPGSSMGGAMWDGTEGASSLIRRADHAQYADKATMKAVQRGAVDQAQLVIPPALPLRPREEDPRSSG